MFCLKDVKSKNSFLPTFASPPILGDYIFILSHPLIQTFLITLIRCLFEFSFLNHFINSYYELQNVTNYHCYNIIKAIIKLRHRKFHSHDINTISNYYVCYKPPHLTEHKRQFKYKQIKKTQRSNKGNKNTS